MGEELPHYPQIADFSGINGGFGMLILNRTNKEARLGPLSSHDLAQPWLIGPTFGVDCRSAKIRFGRIQATRFSPGSDRRAV